ncbi:amidohydrolase family protein [uncultured Sphaerochaeta sp.]|uniref:amidohydrolase family protein n=1 Tax=uncultured Sphaerochaeta sp. TaxID=886478 RepID=UPI002A0A1D90|nr:amidohydrolase family protein [uncultured Sphaerochaeta sp.]
MKWYTNGNLFLGKSFDLLGPGSFAVEDGKIVAIEKGNRPEGLDLQGAYVIPAFVNGHCHLADTGAKEMGIGLSVEATVTPPNGLKHQYLRSLSEESLISLLREGMEEMLRNGICACADYREGGVKGIEALRKAQTGLPLQVLALGRPLADSTQDPLLGDKELHQILELGDGLGIPGINSFSRETLLHMRILAKNKLLSIHISESPSDYRQRLARKEVSEVQRALEIGTDFLVHLTHTDEEDIALLQASGQPIICCPRTNCLLGDGIPHLEEFEKAGLFWGLGTDNMMFSSPDLFRELDFASRITRGRTERPSCLGTDLLKQATWMGSSALGLEKRMGTLEVGKDASFLALDSHSPAFSHSRNIQSSIIHRAGPADIAWFICNGIEVIRDHQFLFAS